MTAKWAHAHHFTGASVSATVSSAKHAKCLQCLHSLVHMTWKNSACNDSTCMLLQVQLATECNHTVAVVKSCKDTRYAQHWVVTHAGRCVKCFTAATLQDFRQQLGAAYDKFDVIAIDEAQFFTDLVGFCETAADVDGKHVIVAGLCGDFLRRPFGSVLDLVPLADSITKLAADCFSCNRCAMTLVPCLVHLKLGWYLVGSGCCWDRCEQQQWCMAVLLQCSKSLHTCQPCGHCNAGG